MSKHEQHGVTGFFTLKAIRHEPVQTGVADSYHMQAFQLLAMEK
jgi:hypothetical protein